MLNLHYGEFIYGSGIYGNGGFINPINDRTLTDVLYVKDNQNSSNHLKGALNYSDLNRIENKKYFSNR